MAREILKITVEAEVTALRVLRRALEKALNAALANTALCDKIQDIMLAADEAGQNIIRHAFGEAANGQMTLTVHLSPKALHICIIDTAPLMDLTQIHPRDLDNVREGGLGTHFIRTLADKAVWQHENGKNRLDMEWYFDPAPPPPIPPSGA